MTYAEVLQIVPGLHARPPMLPSSHGVLPNSPTGSFDLILHMGQGVPGCIALETLAHKDGYILADAAGKFAPIMGRAGKKSASKVVPRTWKRVSGI